jgi:hypothetical protein
MSRAGALLATALALAAAEARAQSGQAETAVQGYYLRTGSQLAVGTTGALFKFEEFLPNIGLLRGSLEAYQSESRVQPGDNYLQLRGLVWQGLRWNFNTGDFRASGSPLRNPFTNLFFPEISARGIQIEAGDNRQAFAFFYGTESLQAGPRIPFRIGVPQKVMAASMRRRFGKSETGVRLLYLRSTTRAVQESFPFPVGRDFSSAANLTLYSSYTFNDHLRWYGEATMARARSADGIPPGPPLSYFFGPAWESPRLTVRLNYANFTRSYFPLAGYWIGDRKGPFGEIRIRPVHRIELFGSANRYESASKPADKLPILRSTGASAGLSAQLPLKWNVSAQFSNTNFDSSDPTTEAPQHSSNREWTATLSRRLGSHTLRLTERDMRLIANGTAGREKSHEVEDTFQIRHVVVGAGARAQQSADADRRNAIYVRGFAQLNLGRLSASGFFEDGKDLANRTVFATSSVNSTVVSASLRVTRHWSVQAEAFRSRLISQINPENLFVQGNQNLMLNPVLSQFNQWSFLFRVSRIFTWGAAMPATGLDQFTVQRIPITGTVEGMVFILTASGRQPAAEVAITLESGRTALTGPDGHYRLADVPEGAHVATINLERLPADFNPGPVTRIPVMIGPRKIARADFDLYSLGGFAGKVTAGPASGFESLEGILVRLQPGGRYTTTDKDGNFAFYNLPEETYQVEIAVETLPAEARLKSDSAVPQVIRSGVAPKTVRFEIERRSVEKPVRRVIDKVLGPPQASNPPSHN